ncbi:MAG: hypothetical protein P4L98_09220, partial [Ancalomicrobiaceae bacterium]|nr:hypothetical protein [Ancalomicrobiaceae bacterium]
MSGAPRASGSRPAVVANGLADRPVRLVDPGATAAVRRGAQLPRLARGLSRAGVPVALLVLWQAAAAYGGIDETVLPAPLTIFNAFAELIRTGELQSAIPTSLGRSATGLALGAGTGLALG